MDRTIVYPASIPQDTDILSLNRNAMLAVGYLAQATLGTATVADGLACTPTTPSSMSVVIGPGSITSFGAVDINAYGSLPADTSEFVVKMGINLDPVSFLLTAPTNPSTAINYLIEASLLESDTNPVVLPYYNAANPSQPYTGPNNAGAAQNTLRTQRVQLRLVSGTAAPTNTQLTPPPDAGWFGLYVITVFNSMTSIGTGTIAVYPTSPFMPFKLPQLTPGTSRMEVFATTAYFTPPPGTTQVKVRLAGGGGGGGSGSGGGGGGAGAGALEGYFAVTPGVPVACNVGMGGGAGQSGGSSSFGTLAVASGGAGASGATGGSAPGSGSGAGFVANGTPGQNGAANSGGDGGGSLFGPGPSGAVGTNQNGVAATLAGSGGSGATGSGTGGAGAAGVIVVEW